jgi:predicted nucleotidyltransferase
MVNAGGLPFDFSSDALEGVCREFRVRELILFGSVLRQDFRPNSDVDLLVDFEPDARVGLLTLSRLRRELESIFHRNVDLVPKGGLKPAVRDEIGDLSRILYAA